VISAACCLINRGSVKLLPHSLTTPSLLPSLPPSSSLLQVQEVPGQVVWTFLSPAGESEPVSGGYRVYVGREGGRERGREGGRAGGIFDKKAFIHTHFPLSFIHSFILSFFPTKQVDGW